VGAQRKVGRMDVLIPKVKASKRIVSCEASAEEASTTSVSRDPSSKISQNKLPKRAFRAMLPFCTTAPCIPKFQNVRFATVACAKMYESVDHEPTRFAHTKM